MKSFVNLSLVFVTSIFTISCGSSTKDPTADIPIVNPKAVPVSSQDSLKAISDRFGVRVEVPKFEISPEEIDASTAKALAEANQKIEQIVLIPKSERTFENTIRAIDDLLWDVSNIGNRFDLIKETSQNASLRNHTADKLVEIKQWTTSFVYREDLYRAVVEFSERFPNLASVRGDLSSEDLKYYSDLLRTYRQAGMNLSKEKRDQVEALQKRLDELSTQFQKNTNEDQTTAELTPAEMDGVPSDALDQYKRRDGNYLVAARFPTQASPILDYGKNEEARRKVLTARYQVAMDKNVPVFEEALRIRQQIATILGSDSWADYRMENRMAKNFVTANKFISDLAKGLRPRMEAEIAEMLELKKRDTGDPSAEFKIWDYYYYMNALQMEKYAVNHEELKNFFPSSQVLAGMFKVYEKMFQVKFTEINAPYKWVEDLQLFLVQDARSLEPLGLIYFDLFPREGKYDHFAQFGITNGKRLVDGTYQRPVVAVVCNFPAPTADAPSLLTFDDVQTMFHEFGHAMHSVLTRADYNEYSGTSTQDDFVEAPSQMLENWVMQKEVMDMIAADWRDSSRKISQDDLNKIKQAKYATQGIFYSRQMALALSDFRFHAKGETKDSTQILNDTFAEFFLPLPGGTNFAASWGHMMGGYDAGYYSYAWSEVIASDMFTPFKANPRGFVDAQLGLRLRNEIYAAGGARDAADSVRAFLGRDYSIEPFLAEFGIKTP